MILVTSRRESPWHREQHYFLALEHLVGGLPAGSLGRHHAKLSFGNMIAHLDGHGLILVSFGGWKMTPSTDADGAGTYARQPPPYLPRVRGGREGAGARKTIAPSGTADSSLSGKICAGLVDVIPGRPLPRWRFRLTPK